MLALAVDYISINGTRYSGFQGPANVPMAAGDTITWSADGSVSYGGFVICGSTTPAVLPPAVPPPPPSPPSPRAPIYSPAPPAAAGDWWVVVGGGEYCHVTSAGRCVTDGEGAHGNRERCEVRATRSRPPAEPQAVPASPQTAAAL